MQNHGLFLGGATISFLNTDVHQGHGNLGEAGPLH